MESFNEFFEKNRKQLVYGSIIILILALLLFWYFFPRFIRVTTPTEMASISGIVFLDEDMDGLLNPNEIGIPGVVVRLYNSSGRLFTETTTENGTFSFPDLNPGNYSVREEDLSDWISTTPNTLEVTVGEGENLFVSFGDAEREEIIIEPVEPSYGSLFGIVYNDSNNNGELDIDEIGRENVTISLYNSSGYLWNVSTGAIGDYLFEQLIPGEYILNETLPVGWYNTTDRIVEVTVIENEALNVNFGIGPHVKGDGETVTEDEAYIEVTVFNDKNEDGEQGDTEPGVKGVKLFLYRGTQLVSSEVTNDTGMYVFTVTIPGQYTIVEQDLVLWESTTPNEVELNVTLKNTYEVVFGDKKIPPPPPVRYSITGKVFNDKNMNEIRDEGETGIQGVTLSLYKNGDFQSDEVTDENGEASFTGLSSGSYSLVETDPSGYFSTTPNTVEKDLPASSYTISFGDAQYSSISGYAFEDQSDNSTTTGNGVFDDGELGISNVTIDLYDSEGLVASTTTDENGFYMFTELIPGYYEITSSQPEEYFRTTSGIVELHLIPGETENVDFGYASEEFGVLFGSVYNDENGSQSREFGELGLSNVTVNLVNNTEIIDTVYTDLHGRYTIKITFSGVYDIDEIDPPSMYSTTTDPITGVSAEAYGSNDSPYDFGDTYGATASGMVFDDDDRDGEKDEEETGVEGVTIKLYKGEVYLENTTTDSNGTYSFIIIESGEHSLEEIDLPGWNSTTTNQLLFTIGTLTGQEITGKDFGDYQIINATVIGTVFNDTDGNGEQDVDEDGLAEVIISLYDNEGELVDSTQTNENGTYEFKSISPGMYSVNETNPPGYSSTTPDVVVIELTEGEEETVDFGDTMGDFSVVYGTVWNDENQNGLREVELGIENVTVSVYLSNEFVDSDITDSLGRFTIKIMETGTYIVEETNLPGWVSTTPDNVTVSVTSIGSYEVDFGDFEPSTRGRITGEVFYDKNKNGTKESGEQLIPDMYIVLWFEGSPVDVTQTNTTGQYIFDDLPLGEYTVMLYLDLFSYPITNTTKANVTVNIVSDELEVVNFGVYSELGSAVTGETFVSINMQPFGSITLPVQCNISLYDESVLVNSTKSQPMYYLLAQPGNYTVNSTVEGIPFLGTGGLQLIPADALGLQNVTPTIVPVTLELFQVEQVNFEYESTISGLVVMVFNDTNRNGVYEGESVIDNVTIQIYDENGVLVTENTTDSYYGYGAMFTPKPGNYTIVEIDPEGYYSTTNNSVEVEIEEGQFYMVVFGDATKRKLITIDKKVLGSDEEWHDTMALLREGDNVSYNFTMTNIGELNLTNITVIDDTLGVIHLPDSLLVGEQANIIVNSTAPAEIGLHFNTVIVKVENQTFASDTASYFGVKPQLDVLKEVKGHDGEWYDVKAYVKTGENVSYRFTIENIGNVNLTDVNITDSVLGVTINKGNLAIGEVYTSEEYKVVAVKGIHNNTVTVNATYSLGVFNESDSACYEADIPKLSLSKMVSKDNSSWYEEIELPAGDMVYYNFTITNIGDVLIENIELYDHDMATLIPLPQTTLNPGENMTSHWDNTAQIGNFTNTAETRGDWYGIPATDDDTASYFGTHPQILVDKEVIGLGGFWSDTTVAVPVGDDVKYRFNVTNTGNVELTNITVEDDVLGTITMPSTTLDVGASVTSDNVTHTSESGLHTNTVNATGTYNEFETYSIDSVSYYGGTPSIIIDKQIYDSNDIKYIPVNDQVNYTFIITNNGTVPLTDVSVTDDHLGAVTLPKNTLNPSESITGEAQTLAIGGNNTNTAKVTATGYDVNLEEADSATYIGLTDNATIQGKVYYDLNLNGVLDPSEAGISGVTVDLELNSSLIDSTITGPQGEYFFNIDTNGTYLVNETDLVGWSSTSPNSVEVTVPYLYDQVITVNFGDAQESYEEREYYLAYEDACNNTFEDFGMLFDVKEKYLNDYLTEIQMNFTSRIYDSNIDHLVHLKRYITGGSTVTIERPNQVPSAGNTLGRDEKPAGTYSYDGNVDIILFNTRKYANPSKQIDELVKVTITIDDPLSNPLNTGLTPPRYFTNNATEAFHDLDYFWANYDPYEEGTNGVTYHISSRVSASMWGSPSILVPRILCIPNVDWIPPYTSTLITGPYGYFDDYYRNGPIEEGGVNYEDWWMPELVTNNNVEPGGLSWGPYP